MDYYQNIKETFINNEINKRVKNYSINKKELESYYNVGKILFKAGKHYGEGIIKEYSKKLTKELGKGYTYTSLTRILKFYKLIEKVATMSQQLEYNIFLTINTITWSHYVELLKINDINKINYYLQQIDMRNLSVRELRKLIKENEYERLPISSKEKLRKNQNLSLIETIKNPILINNTNNIDKIKEKTLQKLILEDLNNFLSQLGNGYSYIKNEYKIKIENNYNYIDILLYNVIYHSYVVIELKVTKLRKEHIGQIQVYMNYIDENIKGINDNKTIGLIVVKENNEYIIKYSSDDRIKSIEYNIV
ncbi:MAG: DUF1016 family protein [Bacilli bacterium]|nr:DUF1016 family protein [Bacilli bacterium]